jgi:hypothetical protein
MDPGSICYLCKKIKAQGEKMTSTIQLIQQGRNEELWTKYCGFFDLELEEFMEIQERLLLEQIDLLGKSMMGRMLMGDIIPTSMEEFRQVVPLTTYKDYIGYLDKKREDVLPRKPYMWSHTSGRSGDFRFKWVPYTKKMYDRIGEVLITNMILSSCTKRGEVHLEPNDKLLLASAPPPYITGLISRSAEEQANIRFLPSLEEGEEMEFGERIKEGFKLAMLEGMDYFYGIASVLVNIGEQFEKGSGSSSFSLDMLRPNILYRMIKGMLKARINKRNMLPKDIWKLKGIITGGADTIIYEELIEYYWGKKPLEGYGCTEGGGIANQAWNRNGMTFFPENNFLEFIPHDEHKKNKEDPDYQPKTLLFDELKKGIYELVFTNFHGGVFTRYRVGDLVEVISLEDREININLPQINFYARADDIINLAGFALLTEKDIWSAIDIASVDYHDWVARKEVKDHRSYLHLYIEVENPQRIDKEKYRIDIHKHLRKINSDIKDLEDMLGYDPLKLTLLRPGSFGSYMEYQESQGADLAHTKPPHMQPSGEQLSELMKDRRIKNK